MMNSAEIELSTNWMKISIQGKPTFYEDAKFWKHEFRTGYGGLAYCFVA